MDIVELALRATIRNWKAVLLYLVADTVAVMAYHVLNYALLTGAFGEVSAPTLQLIDLIEKVSIACVDAWLVSMIFTLIGRDMDRPLWKVEGLADGVKRFFGLWLLIGLVFLTLSQLTIRAAQAESPLQGPLYVLLVLVLLTAVPVGACIMFRLHFRIAEAPASLVPLFQQLPRTLVILCLSWFVFALVASAGPGSVPQEGGGLDWVWKAPIIEGVAGFFDCVIFAATWALLMIHRDTFEDSDFDF